MSQTVTTINYYLNNLSPRIFDDIPGWFYHDELYTRIVKDAKDGDVFLELGAFLGQSSCFMAEEIKKSGKNIKFYVVDTFDTDYLDNAETKAILPKDFYPIFQKGVESLDLTKYITTLKMTTIEAAKYFEEKDIKFNFIMIDTLHDYESVKRELLLWKDKVLPNGILAGDDFYEADVRKALEEILGTENKDYVRGGYNWAWWEKKYL